MLLKRRNPTGLIPFPRVGKRGYTKWRPNDLGTMKRREGLIPFPRIGKSLDHSKAKTNDDVEFLLAWIGPRLEQNTNSADFSRNILAAQLPEYIHNLQPNERETKLFSGDRINPSKTIDELVLPEDLMNSINELSSKNGNTKLEQDTMTTNLASDGWHSLNLEHVIE
ncbi:hypothetical protein V9T40_006098 [Parthenolecanium corni]|uniref:Uncharacterized protein n=1 Tax=Parthenolecanium corni TaxID=536013 RepID=A0AAN9TU32_9HEMI